ncbi:tRNA uridine-5-carboxymethylaminomethyl(34) synthesis enzyme MnmG [Planctomycetales bacterium ZRK34]|nr:tRNA uridine-5-carboxymethylaminomethyl(34) synthesis enzyme MnmG [Planctomycetales bacterium ZRK34]
MSTDYDIIVIGGGHAGAEAAWAAANCGARTALVTMDPARIGQMSCNPAIGGLAKGQIVREIDALGGLMGRAIDATGIQFRMLNQSKGPAVRGPRAQADKYAYMREVHRLLRTRENLTIIAGAVEEILVQNGRCAGITLGASHLSATPQKLTAHATVLTTGTFMRGLLHRGPEQTPGGRIDEPAANVISDTLRGLGFELGRLKTGTPPRLDATTLDYDQFDRQPGDQTPTPFSDLTTLDRFPVIEQRPCWITYTDQHIHDHIRANLDRAPMFNGQVKTTGPRYCPSIEDKVVRFADKSRHTVFLEPESLETKEMYCNGISTSLPRDVQDEIVARLPGCEHAKILRYGYAVEYDMVLPHQIDATCMTKRVPGLFLAGQINGTTGYEEAGAQGVMAGLNAVRYMRDEDLVRLGRDQAYIGVLMDDLVTKVPREPYRMFTSRAEHRLMLRADNAPERLTELGREWGLVDDHQWGVYEQRREALDALRKTLDAACGLHYLKRPEVGHLEVLEILNGTDLPGAHDPRTITALLSEIKYAPFVERHVRDHQRVQRMEHRPLPTDFDYTQIKGLRNEAVHVLGKFRPATFGQAARLAGINPADLTVLTIALGR